MGHLGVDHARLTAFLQRIDAQFGLAAAYLVGSRARGNELLESDYDLVLVAEGFSQLTWLQRIEAVQAEWDLPVGLHVFPYTPSEMAARQSKISSIGAAMDHAQPVWLSSRDSA